MSTIYEVLELGPIVAKSEEHNILITVNGSYFNVFCAESLDQWTCVDTYHFGSRMTPEADNGLYGQDMTKIMDAAELLLEEVITKEEEDSNE